HTQAYVGNGATVTDLAGNVVVTSTSADDASATQIAGSGSIGVSVAAAAGKVDITTDTRAYVEQSTVTANTLTVQTIDPNHKTTRRATAAMNAGSVGLVGATVAGAMVNITGDVQA